MHISDKPPSLSAFLAIDREFRGRASSHDHQLIRTGRGVAYGWQFRLDGQEVR